MSSQVSTEVLVDELTSLRARVMGITESVIATADGMLIAADTVTAHPESVAALAAAMHGLGHRIGSDVGMGGLRDVVTRCAGGYVVVLSIRGQALLVLLADEGLDTAGLYREAPVTVESLAGLLL